MKCMPKALANLMLNRIGLVVIIENGDIYRRRRWFIVKNGDSSIVENGDISIVDCGDTSTVDSGDKSIIDCSDRHCWPLSTIKWQQLNDNN